MSTDQTNQELVIESLEALLDAALGENKRLRKQLVGPTSPDGSGEAGCLPLHWHPVMDPGDPSGMEPHTGGPLLLWLVARYLRLAGQADPSCAASTDRRPRERPSQLRLTSCPKLACSVQA